MILTWIILVISIILFFLNFEAKKTTARDITLLASLTAVAVVGRVIFAAFPSMQPTSFIIIISAIIFGPQVAMLIGAISPLVSNMFMGQGPWTPWQMLGWALMGLVAGVLFHKMKIQSQLVKVLFGIISGFVFGVCMDLWFVVAYLQPLNKEAILLGLGAGILFNVIHGVNNGVLMALFGPRLEKILERVKIKFGVLD